MPQVDAGHHVQIVALAFEDAASKNGAAGPQAVLGGTVGGGCGLETDAREQGGLFAQVDFVHDVAGGDTLLGPVAAGIPSLANHRRQGAATAQSLLQILVGKRGAEFGILATQVVVTRFVAAVDHREEADGGSRFRRLGDGSHVAGAVGVPDFHAELEQAARVAPEPAGRSHIEAPGKVPLIPVVVLDRILDEHETVQILVLRNGLDVRRVNGRRADIGRKIDPGLAERTFEAVGRVQHSL